MAETFKRKVYEREGVLHLTVNGAAYRAPEDTLARAGMGIRLVGTGAGAIEIAVEIDGSEPIVESWFLWKESAPKREQKKRGKPSRIYEREGVLHVMCLNKLFAAPAKTSAREGRRGLVQEATAASAIVDCGSGDELWERWEAGEATMPERHER